MHHFDAEACLAAIERYRVTHVQFVPTHLVRILKLDPDVRAEVRPLEPPGDRARRRTVPARREARRHRVLRTEPARVLRGQRRRRVLLHRLDGLAGAPRVGRQAVARRRPRHRRGRQGATDRRAGTDLVRVVEPVRVPRRQAEDGRGLERPGLDDARRRRLRRRRGLRVPHRPCVEHDHLGRSEHLPPRDRGRAHRPPRGARRRRHRRPAPGDG